MLIFPQKMLEGQGLGKLFTRRRQTDAFEQGRLARFRCILSPGFGAVVPPRLDQEVP
jgi:hypothetical protein